MGIIRARHFVSFPQHDYNPKNQLYPFQLQIFQIRCTLCTTLHRDHRIVGRATLAAVYPLARDHLNFPELAAEGLTPHTVSQVWLFASSVANGYVDISAGLERKSEARLLRTSQTVDGAALRVNWRKRAAVGEPAGLAAEAFTVLQLA